jgi:hypothetical protein
MKAKPDESPEAYVLRLRLRIDALEAALRDVCAAAVHTDWTMRGTPHYCAVCDGMEDIDGTTVHADDCPVAAALALLEAPA